MSDHDSGLSRETMCAQALRYFDAMCRGEVRPALYYTEQEQRLCGDGIVESDDTVRSKMRSKELYPQG